MPFNERAILFKINEQIVKMQQPPASTFAQSTGEVPEKPEIKTPAYSVFRPPSSQEQG